MANSSAPEASQVHKKLTFPATFDPPNCGFTEEQTVLRYDLGDSRITMNRQSNANWLRSINLKWYIQKHQDKKYLTIDITARTRGLKQRGEYLHRIEFEDGGDHGESGYVPYLEIIY